MPKINQEEYEILKSLDDKWKWIARDSAALLWAHETKPRKFVHSFVWGDPEDVCHLIYGDRFHFVKWEDEEPYSIAALIEEYDVDKLTDDLNKEIKRIKKDHEELEE